MAAADTQDRVCEMATAEWQHSYTSHHHYQRAFSCSSTTSTASASSAASTVTSPVIATPDEHGLGGISYGMDHPEPLHEIHPNNVRTLLYPPMAGAAGAAPDAASESTSRRPGFRRACSDLSPAKVRCRNQYRPTMMRRTKSSIGENPGFSPVEEEFSLDMVGLLRKIA